MDELNFVEKSAISRKDQELLDDLYKLSYFFGAWLGDGNSYYYPNSVSNRYGVSVDCMDADIVFKCYSIIQSVFPRLKGKLYSRIIKSGTTMYQCKWYDENLTQFTLFYTTSKHRLPDYIWNAPKEYKLLMLMGLMDTDGTITSSFRASRDTGKQYYRLIFSGKQGFVKQFPDLCRMCGINTSQSTSSRDGTIDFRLSLPDAISNGFDFYCSRKKAKLLEYLSYSYGVKGGRPKGS